MIRTALVLVPHPDDAEFFAGGTLAKMTEEGDRVVIVTTTDGSKGSFDLDGNRLVKERREEAQAAAEVIGAELLFLEHKDFELDLLPPGYLREQYVRLIRQYRPDVVFTLDPLDESEPHPDHRAVARAAGDAVNYSFLPLLYPEHEKEGLTPHYVTEKYYFSEVRTRANKVVDVTGTFDRKIAALAEHKSQMVFLVQDVFRQLRLAGIDPANLLGEAAGDPMAAVTLWMRSEAMEAGAQAGHDLGEAFRYVRFVPVVENIITGLSAAGL